MQRWIYEAQLDFSMDVSVIVYFRPIQILYTGTPKPQNYCYFFCAFNLHATHFVALYLFETQWQYKKWYGKTPKLIFNGRLQQRIRSLFSVWCKEYAQENERCNQIFLVECWCLPCALCDSMSECDCVNVWVCVLCACQNHRSVYGLYAVNGKFESNYRC